MDLKPYFLERLEDAENLSGGNTNQVYLTQDNTVIKIFSRHSFDVLVMAIGYFLLKGKFRYLGPEQRIANEVKAREALGDELNIPEIIQKDENVIEYSFKKGDSLPKKLTKSNARKIGQRMGSILDYVEKDDLALVDCKLNNFILSGEEIVIIDLELSNANPSKIEHRISIWTMLMSAKTLDSEIYELFIAGFEEDFREIRSITNNFIGTILAIGLVTVIDHDPGKLLDVFRNSFY